MVTRMRLDYTYIAGLVSLRKDLKFLTLLWHSFINLRNSSSPPFVLLASTSPVRDIILQYSFVLMLLPSGLYSLLIGIFRPFFGVILKFKQYCIKVVVSVSCCRITIYSFFTVSKAVSHGSLYESHFCWHSSCSISSSPAHYRLPQDNVSLTCALQIHITSSWEIKKSLKNIHLQHVEHCYTKLY
jgi:hypothetical protein